MEDNFELCYVLTNPGINRNSELVLSLRAYAQNGAPSLHPVDWENSFRRGYALATLKAPN
jgi:hypothetical protein